MIGGRIYMITCRLSSLFRKEGEVRIQKKEAAGLLVGALAKARGRRRRQTISSRRQRVLSPFGGGRGRRNQLAWI
jgi:hypothetical protein